MNKEQYLKLYKKLRRIERLLVKTDQTPLPITKAVRYTGLSKSHIYKLTHQNAIPFYKPEGKRIYFLKSDLDNYLLRNRISTKEEIEERALKYLKP